MADFAAAFVLAVGAAAIGDLAEAGQRGDRPIDEAQHLAEGQLVRRPQQDVAAQAAAAAGDDPRPLQFEQDLLEEFLGIACAWEISEIISEVSGGTLDSTTSARSAYLAFCEIIETRPARPRYSAIPSWMRGRPCSRDVNLPARPQA